MAKQTGWRNTGAGNRAPHFVQTLRYPHLYVYSLNYNNVSFTLFNDWVQNYEWLCNKRKNKCVVDFEVNSSTYIMIYRDHVSAYLLIFNTKLLLFQVLIVTLKVIIELYSIREYFPSKLSGLFSVQSEGLTLFWIYRLYIHTCYQCWGSEGFKTVNSCNWKQYF